MIEIPDHVLGDLQKAMRALDELPNEIEVEGLDVTMPVAAVSAILGQVVRFLELQVELSNVDLAKRYIEKGRVALNAGDLEATRRFHRRAARLLSQEGF